MEVYVNAIYKSETHNYDKLQYDMNTAIDCV